MDDKLPDHVRDYRLETLRIKTRKVIHVYSDPNAPPSSEGKQECWSSKKRIGYGGQGQVFLQTCGSRQRAVKKIPLEDGSRKQRYIRELETIIKFSHDKYSKHFVKSLGWYKSRDSLYIAMEYFPKGDLETFLIGNSTNPTLPEDDACQITSQVLQGLAVMHREGFAHRDVKPKNVLIQQHPTPTEPGSWWVKLTDFGISKRLGAAARGASTVIGTPDYMAPELFSQDSLPDINYLAADMWALGVMTLFILTFRSSRSAAFEYARSSDGPFPRGSLDHVSPDGQAFIRALIRSKPDERPDSNVAVRHAWVEPWIPSAPTTLDDTRSDSSTSSSGRSSLDEEIGMETRPTIITGLPGHFRVSASTHPPLPVIPREQPSEAFCDHISTPHAEAPSRQSPMCDEVQIGSLRAAEKGHEADITVKPKAFPLEPDLYERMMKQISGSNDANIYKEILAIASVVYRPITLDELKVLAESLEDLEQHDLEEIIRSCSSFLTLREGVIYFVHQSAKDFLLNKASDQILPSGTAHQHYAIFLRSLKSLSGVLRRDICDLHTPGSLIDQILLPDPDPLALIRYSCVFWVDHLHDSDSTEVNDVLRDNGNVHRFIQEKYLYWLECLSLLRKISEGVNAVHKLEALVKNAEAQQLIKLLRDARRFILSNRRPIEIAPLQAYASALVFSPEHSLNRELFKKEEPDWMISKPKMEADWSACLQTLDGHGNWVASVAFSADGERLASGSYDGTVKIWDTAMGACVQTLEGHGRWVTSVAYSADGERLASGSYDKTVKIWDAAIGACMQTLKGHDSTVTSVAFSADGERLASGSYNGIVKIWDTATGACVQTLEGHGRWVTSVTFSADSERLALGSYDKTVKIWDMATGAYVQTLEGHGEWVMSVAFSTDGQRLASGSYDKTVKIWDAATGACIQTLNVGRALYHLAFDPTTNSLLSTDIGLLNLDHPALPPVIDDRSTAITLRGVRHSGWGISTDGVWIVKDGKDMLWLPPDYRRGKSAVAGSTVAIGCHSGRVLVMKFS